MGPYCRFCDRRCFVHMPEGTPEKALKAYGTSTIIATCPGGQQFEMERVGWCYDKIQNAIAAAKAPPALGPLEVSTLDGRTILRQAGNWQAMEGGAPVGEPIPKWEGIAIVMQRDPETTAAYARLFAASPRLLASLKRLAAVAVWDEDTDREEFDAALKQAEETIAKAEGRAS